MSSYSCVIPLDWNVLWERVIPAWISVVGGKMPPETFASGYAPGGGRFEGDVLVDPDEDYKAPLEYLFLFSEQPLRPPYLRTALDASGCCAGFLQCVDTYASPLLEMAIKQSAAVDLPGADAHADNYLAKTTFVGGERLVAGTKNMYRFLERWFEVSWQAKESRYDYVRRQLGEGTKLQALLEALFLYERAIPGVWFPRNSPSWPGHDDMSFAGYLSPEEVKDLADALLSPNAVWDDSDEVFLLFLDRVARSARHGYGLLTIHGGL